MPHRCWADWFPTSDFGGSAPRLTQKVTFDQTYLVRAIRTWVMVYNNPTFTSLSMRVYGNNVSGTIAELMQTSNTTWTKSQITSENNAAREIYFEFTPALKVISGESLHFGLWASGYTGTDSAHLGWIKAFPDPINTTGLTVTPDKIGTLPVKIAIIGDPL